MSTKEIFLRRRRLKKIKVWEVISERVKGDISAYLNK
jgi:hypothetical protein